jgi:trk system potassium uptake protein TrkA
MSAMRQQVLVVGLGRFGSAVARELERLGHEVLAIDGLEEPVNAIAKEVTHALQLDATHKEALRAAGAADFEVAVVAMSSDAEASIFAVAALKELGVPNVIAKAGSELHGAILTRVGASRVVFPEREMGIQLAHTISTPNVVEYLEVAPGFGIEKIDPPAALVGKTLGELDLPRKARLTPLAIRRGDRVVVNPDPTEVVGAGDELVLVGKGTDFQRLRG